jgi:hypothetical protein
MTIKMTDARKQKYIDELKTELGVKTKKEEEED